MGGHHTFSTTIDQWLQALGILHVNHADKSRINPSSGLDAVETADDNLELHIVILVFVLNLAHIWCNLDAFHSLLYESCSNFGLGLPNVRLPE